jgi:hypothetical protein
MRKKIYMPKRLSALLKRVFRKNESSHGNTGNEAAAGRGNKWKEFGDRHFNKIFISIIICILLLAILIALTHFNKVLARNMEEIFENIR